MEIEIHMKHTNQSEGLVGILPLSPCQSFSINFPLLPLTQINSHLWRRRDKRGEGDHLPEIHRGKWRNCLFCSMPFLHIKALKNIVYIYVIYLYCMYMQYTQASTLSDKNTLYSSFHHFGFHSKRENRSMAFVSCNAFLSIANRCSPLTLR